MLTVNKITAVVTQMKEIQKKQEIEFNNITASTAKLGLLDYAIKNNIKLDLDNNEFLDSGCAYSESNRIVTGMVLRFCIWRGPKDFKTIHAAVIAHELGHMATKHASYNKKRRICPILGLVNKYVLKSELYASAWGLRFLKQFNDIDLKLARQFLKVCYSTYRANYQPVFEREEIKIGE